MESLHQDTSDRQSPVIEQIINALIHPVIGRERDDMEVNRNPEMSTAG